jgi:ribosome-associated protein
VTAARAAAEKNGTDVLVLAVGEVLAITDFFVIATATSNRQVRTIVDAVEEQVGVSGGPKPRRIEGLEDLRWVLMDYGDFVVHVFVEEARRYYELERLWADVARIPWEDETSRAAQA